MPLDKIGIGDIVLSDFDPSIGRVEKWGNSAKCRIKRFTDKNYVSRLKKCILKRNGRSTKVGEFSRGYLLCKVAKYKLSAHDEHNRNGWVYMAAWYKLIPTRFGNHHMNPEGDHQIYAIIIDDELVYKPVEYPEISIAAVETVGEVVLENLCIADEIDFS